MPLKPKSAHAKDMRARPALMQHRHFATIAAIIRNMDVFAFTGEEMNADDARCELAHHFAAGLAKTNPHFDRERFLAACRDA